MTDRRMYLVVSLLVLALFAPPALGDVSVYLYDDAVTDKVDIGLYLTEGQVELLSGLTQFNQTTPGPAPEPYPQIHVWEPGMEQLGSSSAEIDGINFLQAGPNWKKNKWALVLWKIRVPNASERMVSEFAEDLTLSVWVDWDQSESWDKDEKMNHHHINVQEYLPADEADMWVYYLTCFRIPDIDDLMSANAWGKNADVRQIWIRGTLAYDDSDVSPDGEQLFGEAEDYRIPYWVTSNKDKQEQ